MVNFKHTGNFLKTDNFLNQALKPNYLKVLNKYGEEGVNALSSATPVDSGLTASSWKYKIVDSKGGIRIEWSNTHIIEGVPIAIVLQYGHGTRNGGFVEGRDYINPTLKPIFEKISNNIWKEVIK